MTLGTTKRGVEKIGEAPPHRLELGRGQCLRNEQEGSQFKGYIVCAEEKDRNIRLRATLTDYLAAHKGPALK